MNNNTTRNPEARLTPLTGAEYIALNAYARQNEPTVCPCCDTPTTQGWLDDCGCCYHCSTEFDRPVAPTLPPLPTLDVRLVNRGGRLLLVGVFT